MRRSRAVQLTLVSSVAALLAGCDSRPTRYCVDDYQNVTDDRNCDQKTATAGFPPRYHWYYGGARGAVPIGTHLSGGSPVEPAGGYKSHVNGPEAGTERGVIGEAGEASGGHGGDGGGE